MSGFVFSAARTANHAVLAGIRIAALPPSPLHLIVRAAVNSLFSLVRIPHADVVERDGARPVQVDGERGMRGA